MTSISPSDFDQARQRLKDQSSPQPGRDVLSPREVAIRTGFSYHAVLRAIRRGDLQAFEPVAGHYRIELAEYERWLRTPTRTGRRRSEAQPRRARNRPSDRGSLAALHAIERDD